MVMPTHIVAVGGIVEDGNGNILLVKTRNGGWVFPGGQVEVGENLPDALIREIKEESGIDVTVSKLIGVYSNTAIHKWYDGVTDVPTKVILDFTCELVGGELAISGETSTNAAPGEVVKIAKDYFEVATGDGSTLALYDVQPAGKKRMTAEDYLRGTGSKLQIGDRFE